jgi:hypothetical protein
MSEGLIVQVNSNIQIHSCLLGQILRVKLTLLILYLVEIQRRNLETQPCSST